MAIDLFIDIENNAGVRQGGGPIVSASQWRYTARLDAAGNFAFTMPAGDPKAAIVTKKLVARCYAFLGSARVEVGAGIIDDIQRQAQSNGEVLLNVSGNDLLRELTYRSVLNLKLYLGGNPVSHAAAVAAVGAFAPAGWSFTPDPAPPNNSVYGYFNGESVLQGLIKTAQKSQSHFYRGVNRSLIFASSFTPSGVRAIRAQGDLSPATCAITSLTQQTSLYDLRTRVYPRGSGNAEVQLTLRATTRTAPPGYVLDTINNYIEHSGYTAQYGLIEEQVTFRDIGPIGNTTPDVVAASNMLFDAALEWLKRHSVELDQPMYMVALEGCSQLLRPLQSLRLVDRDLSQGIDVNADLNILEATWSAGPEGIATTGVKVSTADRLPDSDASVLVGTITEGRIYQALPQLNANSYVTAYRANVDSANMATFRFRFGGEVTQLQQVFFEFQVLAFESTVKSISSVVASSSAGGSSVQSGSSGGSHNHTVTIPNHSHTVTISAHTHTYTVAAHAHTYTVLGHNHTYTVAGHAHTYTVAAHAHTYTDFGHGHTVTIPAHTHPVPDHIHTINVIGPANPTYPPMRLDFSGSTGFLYWDGSGTKQVFSNNTGNTTASSGGGSTQTSSTTSDASSSSSTTSSSSSSSSTTTSSSSSSSTTTDASSSSSTDSGASSSSSSGGASTPSSSSGGGTTQSSDSQGAHTHTTTIPSHTHTVQPVLLTLYGVFREAAINTYLYSDLEYSVNGLAFVSAATSIDAGSGWRRLDITNLVMDANTFRPLQEANTIQIRASASAGYVSSINNWSLSVGQIIIDAGAVHGLNVGDKITISGAAVGALLGTVIDGYYTVDFVYDVHTFRVLTSLPGTDGVSSGLVGTIAYARTGTIDAQLSVRNIIQAVALA